MKRKEDDQTTSAPDSASQLTVATGKWNENITWELILSEQKPESRLVTAVCCVTVFNGLVLLVHNKGFWEFPSGAIEEGESDDNAAMRETREETGAIIQSPNYFGFRRLQAKAPVYQIDNSNLNYPFPTSYISYFQSENNHLLIH